MSIPPEDSRDDPHAPELSDIDVRRQNKRDSNETNPDLQVSADDTIHTRSRRRTRYLMLATSAAAAVALYYGLHAQHGTPPTSTANKTKKQAYVDTPANPSVTPNQTYTDNARIEITPATIRFADATTNHGSQHVSVVATVKSGAYRLNSISIPYNRDTGITEESGDCENRTLNAGERCSIDVSFTPTKPVSVSDLQLDIQGISYSASGGGSKQYSAYVPLYAVATDPPPPVEKAAPTGSGNPFGTAGDPNLAQSRADAEAQKAKEEKDAEIKQQAEARDDYLATAGAPSIGGAANGSGQNGAGGQNGSSGPFGTGANGPNASGQPPKSLADLMRPVESEWPDKSIMSSYPYDMSRLITAGTPIPAVIQYSIDSRYHTTAVAMVERDIYGEDGRLVILEKGSRIIGSASGGNSSGGSGGSGGSTSGQSGNTSSNEKMTVTWRRIVRPDGVIFTISGTSGDAMGRGGIPSVNDNRPWERFGAGIMTSILEAVGIGATGGNVTTTNTGGTTSGGFSSGGTSSTTLDSRALAAQALQQGLSPLAAEFSAEHLSMPVIHIVPAGTRFTIFLDQDIELRPILTRYQAKAALRAQHAGEALPSYAQPSPPTPLVTQQQQYQYPGSPAAGQTQRNAINPYAAPAPTLAPSVIQPQTMTPAQAGYTPTTTAPGSPNAGFPTSTQQNTLQAILEGQ